MNTKHKHYKEYVKVITESGSWRTHFNLMPEWKENELWDYRNSYKFYCFRNGNSDGPLKSRYAKMLNKQDKTHNKRILHNVLKLNHIDDALSSNTEFMYHHKNRSWMYI